MVIQNGEDRFHSAFTALTIVGSGILVAAAVIYARAETVTAGRQLTQSIVNVMAQQTSRSVAAVEHKTRQVAREMSPLSMSNVLTERAVGELLGHHLAGAPSILGFSILDPKGTIIADSN